MILIMATGTRVGVLGSPREVIGKEGFGGPCMDYKGAFLFTPTSDNTPLELDGFSASCETHL